jgi:uncharacterized protein with ParB-like and HNH nuclease domain
MTTIGITNLQQEQISRILEDKNIYCVPYFQREYSWKIDDWRSILEDVKKIQDTGEPHFFGFMTFRSGDADQIYIIEGQQRLSTITIFLAVIRDILYAGGDDDYKDLDKLINRQPPFKTDELPIPKLKLSVLNEDFFKSFVQKIESPDNKLRANSKNKLSLTNQLILGAYRYFYDALSPEISALSGDARNKYLASIIEACTNSLVVISTSVTDEIAAYNIFQTINGRGLDLTLTDLLKVFLFEKSGKLHITDALATWEIMRATLSSINTNSFHRHLWLSTRSLVQEQKLLSEVRALIKTSGQALTFLEELKNESEVYDALLNPTTEYWGDNDMPSLLEELQILSTQQPLPLLLASAKCLPLSDFKKLLRICISFVFRYQTIGEMENKEMERLFSAIAIDLRRQKIKTSKQISERLKYLYPGDDVFKAAFEAKTVKARSIAKYILRTIENNLSGELETVSTTITLEHILPINPDEEWKTYLKTNKMEKSDYVYQLGNYTLLTKKVNKAAQNRFYDKKRDDWYKLSSLKVNESLKKITSWNADDIEARQKWLTENAVKIWKIPGM